jgi:hypothetical protein
MAKYSKEQMEAIHCAYRAMPATLSVADVARKLSIPYTTLIKWIKKGNWERDLSAEVKRLTNIAVTKAALGVDTTRPLNDEEKAIADRVAINVAVITAHQHFLQKMGNTLNSLNNHLHTQSNDLLVAVEDKETGAFHMRPKSLGASIGEGRQLMAAFSDYVKEERRAYGISEDGQPDEVDVDQLLRELAEEAQEHQELPEG